MTPDGYTPDLSNFRPNEGLHRMRVPVAAIMSLAVGADDPYNILTAYGFSDGMIDAIMKDPAIQRAVEVKRGELKREGVIFKTKAAFAAEMLLEEVVRESLNTTIPTTVKHDILKTLAKLGDLEPKQDKQAVAPTGFSVNITIGGKTVAIGGANPGMVVDVEAQTPAKTTENGVESSENVALSDDFGIPEAPPWLAKTRVKMPILTPICEEKP